MALQEAEIDVFRVEFLPIVAAYARKLGLVEEIDRLLDCDMEVSPGKIVLAMILDALSGRSPLFRLKESFADKDVGLLLGEDVSVDKLTDHTLGRVLERLAKVGTNKILGAVAMRVIQAFSVDTSHVHQDTTSQSVYGDYLLYEREDHFEPFVITEGFSKDHRPDLKQLVHCLLCVDHGIPIYSKLHDGNESDKTINRNLIPEMVKRMRELGRTDFIYVADSALVTKENLALIKKWEGGFLFVSRLPLTYAECRRAIRDAVASERWIDIGAISEQPVSENRKPASYKAHETTVTVDTDIYRAVVVFSDAHDRRRQKGVDKQIRRDLEALSSLKKEMEKIEYACLADARSAAHRIAPGAFHDVFVQIEQRPVYSRGRPKADTARTPKTVNYALKITLELNEQAVEKARQEAGCFVLLTNTPSKGADSIWAKELLTIYKDQQMVEQNFAFLKDPVFVNSLFLKSPRRIEALGLVLVLALMIWRLMERAMRINVAATQQKASGWKDKETSRPTSFMMTTKFVGIFVLVTQGQRRLAKPLTPVQLHYLMLLELTPDIFTNPAPEAPPHHTRQKKFTQDSS
jgi:transposase